MVHTKEYRAEWRAKHREKLAEKGRVYYNNHKEQHKAWTQIFEGKRSGTISNWKQRGLIHEDYNQLYDCYINTHKCDVCLKDFTDSTDRCMDHNHETGLFRQILCRNCNNQDNWKKYLKN